MNIGKPDLPYVNVGKPQRADGADSNTPPTSFRLSSTCGTRESPGRMSRTVGVGRRELDEMSDANLGSQMGHSSRNAGKPRTWLRPQGIRQRGVPISQKNAQSCSPRRRCMSDERETLRSSVFREPYAVKAARTVLTGGMEKRAVRYRALSLPTPIYIKRYITHIEGSRIVIVGLSGQKLCHRHGFHS